MTVSARIPLTSFQRDVWVANSQFPDLPQFTIFIYDKFVGPIDAEALAACLVGAVRRNDVFRLRFGEVDGVPYQWLVPADTEVDVELVDLSREKDPAAAVAAWLRDSFATVYDLTVDRAYDLVLLKESDSVTYAYVKSHHIVSDAWGLHLFMSQVRAEYARVTRTGEPEKITPPSFLEAVDEDDRYQHSDRREDDRAFFGEVLADVEPALFARKAPSGSRRTARYAFTLERSLITRIKDRGESPFVFVSAAVALYLGRVHQVDEVLLGVPVLNRPGRTAKQTVGQFANTLPLRVATGPDLSTDDLLTGIRASTRALLRHQRLPLSDVLRDLPKAANAPQLFDTTISYLRWPSAIPIPGVSRETVAQTHAHDQDALAIWIYELDDTSDILVNVEYACDVFDADFPIEAAARHVESLLRGLSDVSERTLACVPMLSPAEYEDLVRGRNATVAEFPAETTLPELFADQVARTPHDVAVVGPDGAGVTFAELDATANRVARALRAQGVGPDDRVAVLSERGPHLLTAILGVLKAGGAYVPVDPGYPLERIRLLLDDSGAKVVLVGDVSVGSVVPIGDITVRRIADLAVSPELSDDPVVPVATARNLAYVIYTSGSTGRPKGVMVEHRSVVNRLWWMQRRYPISRADVLLQKTPISFDVSVWELFWWTFTGARLALPPVGAEKDPMEILRSVERNRVTVVHFVPSMLGPLLDLLEAVPESRRDADSLRLVVCSGEELPPARVAQFAGVFGPRVKLVNLYGPTEATVDVSAYDCPSGNPSRVPIGRPIDNIQLYVLGGHGGPQPVGAPGELCVGGVGVARGYLGRPELTAEKFVDDPFTPGGRMYRTGDLARWLADGTLDYLGRIDSQVKIRGNRVELGEVRSHLAAVPGIREAVVVDRTSQTHGLHLVGYYLADAEMPSASLRAALAAALPEFMIPAYFVRIDEVPLTPNGKIARRRLPEPRATVVTDQVPRNAVEAELAAIWSRILGLESVGVHDNYFAIGGDSILLLRIRALAGQQGIHFAPTDLMQNPTVATLAEKMAERSRSAVPEFDPLVPIRTQGDRPPVFLVHPLGGHVLCYVKLAQQLPPDMPVYALQAAGGDQGSGTPLATIPDMAASYIAAVKRIRPEGPYVLGGWSSGGIIAVEMAQQLRAADQNSVDQVIAIDSVIIRRDHPVDVPDDVLLEFFFWESMGFERSREQIEALPPTLTIIDDKFDHIVARAMSTGALPWGTVRASVRRLFELFMANWRALIDYRPDAIDQDVTLLRATGRLPSTLEPRFEAVEMLSRDTTNGWADWTTGRLEVIDVPGNHLTLIDEPHVTVVATHITDLVDSSRHRDRVSQ